VWKSTARRTRPSRLELKGIEGWTTDAPVEGGPLHDLLVGLAGADAAVV
jgi:hypothetical protein